jgi:hypothetical protein
MVIVMLAGVMFPLWPVKLKLGVWYLSIAVLVLIGAFIGLAIVRLILWCGTAVAMKRAIWIFPNLFEDVGFVSLSSMRSRITMLVWDDMYPYIVLTSTRIRYLSYTHLPFPICLWTIWPPELTPQVDSFIPGWAYDEPPKKKKKRIPGTTRRSKEKTDSAPDHADDDAPTEVVTSPAQPELEPVGQAVRHRQAATVEEIEDDEWGQGGGRRAAQEVKGSDGRCCGGWHGTEALIITSLTYGRIIPSI